MKKILLTLLILQISVLSALALEIITPESVVQGGVITVLLSDAGAADSYSLSFGSDDPNGEVYSRTEAFSTSVDGLSARIALLGVPSTLSPGRYSVNAAGAGSEVSRGIEVVPGEFIDEDIPLSRSMSDLRQSDDLRKAEQWRNLLAILKHVDTEHVYLERALEVPVADYLRLSSFFGDRRRFLYDDGTTARSIHNGIDYSAEPGTPIYAAGAGRVVFSGQRIISGNTVVVEHLPGVYSLYYHMNSLSVAEGAMVEAGGLLGTVGATGLVTGAHLHWEVRVAGVAVDPNPLIAGGLIDKELILSNIERQ